MKRDFSCATAVLACCLGISLPWTAGAHGGLQSTPEIVVESGDVHEVCLELALGEQLDYAFTATGTLQFNIHYHGADHKVIYPVPEHPATTTKELLTAESTQEYCLMWTNEGGNPVTLSVTYEQQGGH
jgi:hypothetical protein